MKKQQSSVKPYPKWEAGLPEKVINNGAQFGILSKLHGTWVNWKGGPRGLHTTPMPSPGTSSETVFGVFHFGSQEYREHLQFTQVNAPVRNRGGSNEQFNGAVKYQTAIIDIENGDLQHFEDGMYLWLGENKMPWNADGPNQNPRSMFSHPSDAESVKTDGAEPVMGPGELGPQFVAPHTISRAGVIPHGTTIHLTGNIKKPTIEGQAPHIADLWESKYLAVSPTMGINIPEDLIAGSRAKPEWTNKTREEQAPHAEPEFRGVNSGRAYILKIFNYDDKFGAKFPFTVQPNLKLIDANKGLRFKKYDLIELDSHQDTGVQGATINNAMVERYCRVVRMRLRMWLEEIYDEDSGKVIDQLQYEQIVDFEFMFGSSGEKTQWPHIQVNTLRRERDIPVDKLLPPIELPTKKPEKTVGGPDPIVCPMGHSRS
tara:strand:+ start:5392 stop:6678 length:1287 start_codon:yes stop_codon:yes gene_type:complete